MDKSPDAFRTISEVAEVLDTPAHVLRFWESRFPQIRPVKRAGGRRYYRPSDVALLSGIKRLLHDEGLTIRGVQKILRDQGARHVAGLADETLPFEETVEDSAAALVPEETEPEADFVPAMPAPSPLPAPAAASSRSDPVQPPLPLFDAPVPAPAKPAAQAPRVLRDDLTLASLIRARPRGRLADKAAVAALARQLTALRQTMADRAEGGPG
jgi:DNA-binding transcriptional MerR regulator